MTLITVITLFGLLLATILICIVLSAYSDWDKTVKVSLYFLILVFIIADITQFMKVLDKVAQTTIDLSSVSTHDLVAFSLEIFTFLLFVVIIMSQTRKKSHEK